MVRQLVILISVVGLSTTLVGCGDMGGSGKIEPIANPPANKAPAGSPHPIPGGAPTGATTGK
jgi:hypothetical protein